MYVLASRHWSHCSRIRCVALHIGGLSLLFHCANAAKNKVSVGSQSILKLFTYAHAWCYVPCITLFVLQQILIFYLTAIDAAQLPFLDTLWWTCCLLCLQANYQYLSASNRDKGLNRKSISVALFGVNHVLLLFLWKKALSTMTQVSALITLWPLRAEPREVELHV